MLLQGMNEIHIAGDAGDVNSALEMIEEKRQDRQDLSKYLSFGSNIPHPQNLLANRLCENAPIGLIFDG
jgi:hypothetical protein